MPFAARALRPVLWLSIAAVIAGVGGSARAGHRALLEYQGRALVTLLAVAAGGAWWQGHRRRREWWFEAVPAAAGATAALTLVGALAGTPFAPGGLGGDQTFRTAAVTRFADSWHNADFTVARLPSFYPPTYFWVLGRIAAITGTEPWRMLKYGTISAALCVPMVAYLLWGRIVPCHLAALISVVPLAVENFYEPYAWITLAAFVPWWLETVHGVRRSPVRCGDLVLLGVIGALLFTTYYYFFLVGVVAAVVYLLAERVCGQAPGSAHLRRVGVVFGVATILSTAYWLPLLVSIAEASQPESLSSRWFSGHHALLPLPMLDPSPSGVVMLAGLGYIVWNAGRDALARGLLVMTTAAYCWYLLGAVAALADQPLLSFRAKPLIPMVLLTGGVLALGRLAEHAATRFGRADVHRVALLLGVLVGLNVGQEFMSTVRASALIEAARDSPRPDQSSAPLESLITGRIGAHAVLVSDRIDVVAYYPNHAFLPWDAHYSHPAAEFGRRVEFLQRLAATADPHEFAELAEHNDYGTIDGFVLLDDGDELVFHYTADAFPNGTRSAEVRFRRSQFAEFELTSVGNHVLITRS